MTATAGFTHDSNHQLAQNRDVFDEHPLQKNAVLNEEHFTDDSNYQELKDWRFTLAGRLQEWRWNISWVLLILAIITLIAGALIFN